jgi:aminopeptidase N
MKKIVLTAIITFIGFLAIAQIAPQRNFNDKMAADERKPAQVLSQNKILTFNGAEYDLKYHRFNIAIDPAVSFISGSVTSYFQIVQPTVSQISFDLNVALTVDSVLYHASSLVFAHTADNALNITLPSPLTLNQLDSVCVYYHGYPPYGDGFGSFIQTTHNGTPVIWTLSEPFGAKDWWPCKNDLSDKIDSVEMIVTTPQEYRAASNGMLLAETTQGSTKTYHWKHRYPIATYLIAVAVTDYSVFSVYAPVNGNNIEVLNYVFPENLIDAQTNVPDIIPVLQLYDSLFAPYPYINERYGHAQFGWGGGMEHQTMTFLVNFGHELMAHELAHQWVGDMITCGNWHDIWLNEGFATYWTGLTYEFMFDQYYWKPWKTYQIENITSEPGGSVYCSDTTSVNRIFDGRLSYAKGGMLLHMLRWVIGDSAFFKGMRNYLSDNSLKYSYACSDDFITHMETASGQSLTWFFDDWLYGEGYPIYSIQCTTQPNNDILVSISQTQSNPSVNFFEMPVALKFKNNTQDTTIVFDNSFSGQSFIVNPGFKSDSALFDPDQWLVALLDTMILSIPEEHDISSTISVFPVPVHDELQLTFGGLSIESVEIADITGRVIFRKEYSNTPEKVSLDCSAYMNGVYVLKIQNGENRVVKKILKL